MFFSAFSFHIDIVKESMNDCAYMDNMVYAFCLLSLDTILSFTCR